MRDEYVATYYGSKILGGARILRANLADAKLQGILDYVETKSLMEVCFHVKASAGVHQSIRDLIIDMG